MIYFSLWHGLLCRIDWRLDKHLHCPVIISSFRKIVRIERLSFAITMRGQRFHFAFDMPANVSLDCVRPVARKLGIVVLCTENIGVAVNGDVRIRLDAVIYIRIENLMIPLAHIGLIVSKEYEIVCLSSLI